MMSVVKKLVSTAWIRSMRKDYCQFLSALGSARIAQECLLQKTIQDNSFTDYGRIHGFERIKTVEQYQRSVPITNYEDYHPFIQKIASGHDHVLTRERVKLFEPSSGTVSASKYIPYTESLLRSFKRGISPWLTVLFTTHPQLARGTSYWSITPRHRQEEFYGTVPVGFDSDSEYLGFIGRHAHALVSAIPENLMTGMSTDQFLEETALCLVSRRDLSLISVWSPSFLITVLDHLLNNIDRICLRLERRSRQSKKRTADIKGILEDARRSAGGSDLIGIWPKLSVISCWTDGPCKNHIEKLKRLFPSVPIQGKGLISTEAFVSFPYLPQTDPVLSINSHFFEFADTETGNILLADQLSIGKEYSVIVTTEGGLYRYALNDIVRCTGRVETVPTIRFISKQGLVSDYHGEKLNVSHVQSCLDDLFSQMAVKPPFALVAPVSTGQTRSAYALFVKDDSLDDDQAGLLVDRLDRLLRENYHYANCQEIGQLGRLRYYKIVCNADEALRIYMEEMIKRGIKAGNVKPAALDRESVWDRILPGEFMLDKAVIS